MSTKMPPFKIRVVQFGAFLLVGGFVIGEGVCQYDFANQAIMVTAGVAMSLLSITLLPECFFRRKKE